MRTAGWLRRLLAGLIDLHVSLLALVFAYLGATWAYDTFAPAAARWLSGVFLAAWVAVGFYNRCFSMGRYGHSWGRHIVGMNLVDERSGEPVGVLRAVAREIGHLADVVSLGIGFLLPLWDGKRQTVADKLVRTVTVEAR